MARRPLSVAADDGKPSSWWLVVSGDHVEVCDFDPGFEVAATIACTLRTLVRVWRGDASWEAAMHAGDVAIDAPSDVSRAIPTWLGQSMMAARPLSAA